MPLASAIVGGASLLGQAFNAFSQNKTNKRQERFTREMYAQQRADSLSDWNMQNSYNDPSAQMSRLQNAGLNPHLVYGNGADAQSQGAPKPVASHSANFKAPQMDFGSVIANALSTKQIQSNIARTDAETDAIKQKTAIGQFELTAKQQIGQSDFTKQLYYKTQNLTAQDQKAVTEFDHWLQLATKTADGTIDLGDGFQAPINSQFINSSIKTTVDTAIAQYNRLIKGNALLDQQRSINELEKILKQAETDFTQALGSKTGAGFALQLLRTLLGK